MKRMQPVIIVVTLKKRAMLCGSGGRGHQDHVGDQSLQLPLMPF